MQIMKKLQNRGGGTLLGKRGKLILLISALVLIGLSYLLISCSQAAFKAANDEPTTTTIPKVKAPTFSVESGTKFKYSILVDINCSTRGAVIRYSYDNVNWVAGTTLLISETKTVYAKATKEGMIDSDVVSAIYICTAVSTTTSTSVKTSTTINAYGSTTTSTIDAYGSTTTSTIDAYGSTTTSTIDTYGSTTIDAYATSTTSSSTSTTTTTINQTDYIALAKFAEPYTEQPCIVNLIFGLKDYAGNILPGIYDTSRYNLMENGAPIAYAEAFYRVKERTLFDVELKTVIMIDISLSVGSSNIEKLKDSVKSIINNKSDNQSIAIYTFSGNVTMVKDFTLDKTELIAAVNGITLGASSTNLYGAIYDGLDRFVNTISNKLVTNTFMIVMTDGQDTSAARSLEEVLTKRGDRSVITVGIGSDVDPETLSSLGNFGSFMAADFDTLQTYIDEARALITETYENVCWMTYYSPKRAGSHTIEVSIKNNSNTGETSKISGVFSASDPQFYDAAPGIYINDSYLSQTGDSEIAFADSDASKTLQINSYFGANEPEYTFELSIPGAYSISEIIPVLKKSYSLTRVDGWNATITIRDTANNYSKTLNITGKGYVALNFNSTGGSAVESQRIFEGNLATKPSDPTRTGYTFSGWYKESECIDQWNFVVDTVAEPIILYARWIGETYTVTFDKQSGMGGTDSAIATYGSDMPTATAPTRTGYTFTGYWDATSGGTQYYTESMASARSWNKAENTTLYARWTVNTYTITFDKQSGTGGTDSVTATYGAAMPTATKPTRTGYTFDGYWDATSGGGTQYYTESMASARSWDKAANTTLYAGWTANQYTVTFDSNGGSSVDQQTINYGEKATRPVIPTKTGYIFSGWYKESTLTNLWDFGSDSVTTDTILYAGWVFDSNPALWAKSVTAGTSYSEFNSVAVDSSGNVYAAGYQNENGSFTYGPGVSVAGTYSGGDYGYNVVLVKYDSSGTALWAKSVTAGNNYSQFYSVAVDSSGNVYAAGYQNGTGSFTYGEGVSVAGTYSGGYYSRNVVLVKYNSTGTALWAKSVTAGTNESLFNSVAVDSSGNIYAAGCQDGTRSYTYGEGVSVAGSYSYGANVVLVKYDATP